MLRIVQIFFLEIGGAILDEQSIFQLNKMGYPYCIRRGDRGLTGETTRTGK